MEPRYSKQDADKTARPYAQAAFELAQQHGTTKDWEEKLGILADVIRDEDMQRRLRDPHISPADMKKIMAAGLDHLGVSEEQRNLVNLLIDNRRLSVLPALSEAFSAHAKKASGLQDVTVYSAFEMTPEQEKNLKRTLKERFNVNANITVKVDPELIGGVRIVMGDRVIDASTKHYLERMRRHLMKKPDGPGGS